MTEINLVENERARADWNYVLFKLTKAELAAARTLVAQQAKRADDAERKAQAHEIDAAAHLRHYHAAQAQAAELRRALEDLLEAASDPMFADECIPERAAAGVALALTPGDALERVKRQTRIETLEALPCERRTSKSPDDTCLIAFEGHPELATIYACPRCKALDAARKGGK